MRWTAAAALLVVRSQPFDQNQTNNKLNSLFQNQTHCLVLGSVDLKFSKKSTPERERDEKALCDFSGLVSAFVLSFFFFHFRNFFSGLILMWCVGTVGDLVLVANCLHRPPSPNRNDDAAPEDFLELRYIFQV